MRITLNLATRPFADLGPAIKRLRWAMGALALVSIALGVGLHFFHHNAELARARDHSLDGSIARIAQERQHYTDMMHRPDNAQLLVQAETLNSLFDEKSFSWTLAMEDLETVLPGGVQVTTLEPARTKEGKIILHLRVTGPRDREVELVQNLEHSRRFHLPQIVGEVAHSSEGPSKEVEPVSATNRFDFDIMAEYSPAAPGERKAAKPPATAADIPAARARPLAPAHRAPQPVRPNLAQPMPGRPPDTAPRRPPIPQPRPKPGGPQ